MLMKSITGTALAVSLSLAPAIASAAPSTAPAANGASSLSLSPAVRAGAKTGGKSHLGGGGAAIYALAIVAGVAAILVIDGTKSDNDSPDSN